MNENKSVFETLFEINVNDHIEKKKDLTYLSWPYAWAGVKKKYPNATYKIHLFGEKQLPYVFDENIGYMVFTDVTINDLTHTMWLPVMDSANKTMKSTSYNKKATIFSSNHSLNELINKSGIAEKTVDRISEMTSGAVMKIEGASLRNTPKTPIF